jgi:hypothetical protein
VNIVLADEHLFDDAVAAGTYAVQACPAMAWT